MPGRSRFRLTVAEIVLGTGCPGLHARRRPTFSRPLTEPSAGLRARMTGVPRSAVYGSGRVCGAGRPHEPTVATGSLLASRLIEIAAEPTAN